MHYAALGPIADHVAWNHVALGTVSVDHIPLGSPVYPQNTTKS